MTDVHQIHYDPDLYAAVIRGQNQCAVLPADRDYKVGDLLRLWEFDAASRTCTGRNCWVGISHVQVGKGLPDGLVALSFPRPCEANIVGPA